MNASLRSALVVAFGCLLAASLRPLPARAAEPPRDYTNASLQELGIKPVPAKKDPKTGFVVGGRNPTESLKSLTEIAGRTIAELEKDMRPGANSEVGSRKGFLGKDEKLLEILAEDNKYVVDELGLTHQDFARHLHVLGAIGAKLKEDEFRYHGRRFKVKVVVSKWMQPSPFYDDTQTNSYVTVTNLDNEKTLDYSLLVPQMIERYGFYEGKGTPYRVDPHKVVEVLAFLKKTENSKKP